MNIQSVDNKYSTDTNDYFTDNDDKSDDGFNVDNEPHDTDYDNGWERENIGDQFPLEYMRNVAQFYDEKDPNTEKRKHSFAGVQRCFKKVKHRNYIHRFRKYIEVQGTKKEKLNHIDSFVYESFKNPRQQLLSIHHIDLKMWPLKKAAKLGDLTFVAGDRWLYEFKKRHCIVSREISKLVTKRDVLNKDVINQSAESFVQNVHNLLPSYILNTDQSGLQLKMFSNRTLSHAGEKITLSMVHSVNNTTHSYTVQPIITMSGKLIGPLLLCLKEPS